jgi:hypothetical protein
MSGKKSKVIQFPTATQKKIVCQYSTDTTTEQSPNRKGNKLVEYYKKEWPTIVGALLGTIVMFLTIYFAALTIHGA